MVQTEISAPTVDSPKISAEWLTKHFIETNVISSSNKVTAVKSESDLEAGSSNFVGDLAFYDIEYET